MVTSTRIKTKINIKAPSTPIFRKRKSGVTRIVRDSYGKKGDWFALGKEIKKRDGYKCIFCSEPEQPKKGIFHDVHHIIRLADGGTNSKSNLGTTCSSCHAKRPGHKHMKEKAKTGSTNKSKNQADNLNIGINSKFSTWRNQK
jgi:HNH endonuclease